MTWIHLNKISIEKVLDFQEVEVGFRTTSWKKHGSFMLNVNHFKLRGFSHHNSIGGLGVAYGLDIWAGHEIPSVFILS